MDEETKRILAEIAEVAHDGTNPMTDQEIANARGDPELLGLMHRMFDAALDFPLPSSFDPLLKRLSFSDSVLLPTDRKKTWRDFLEKYDEWFDWPHTWGIARWYWDYDLNDHAASVYEELHRLAHGNDDVDRGYLLDAIGVFSQLGDEERVRDFYAHVKDAHDAGVVTDDFLREAQVHFVELEIGRVSLLEEIRRLRSELERERLETYYLRSELKEGLRVGEEKEKTRARLLEQYPTVIRLVAKETEEDLVDGTVFYQVRCLREAFPYVVPSRFQSAVEREFNKNIWGILRKDFKNDQLPDEYQMSELSLDKIHEILKTGGKPERAEKRLVIRLKIEKYLGREDLCESGHVGKLGCLRKHSRNARHGRVTGRYDVRELQPLLDKLLENGWIFHFLSLLRRTV